MDGRTDDVQQQSRVRRKMDRLTDHVEHVVSTMKIGWIYEATVLNAPSEHIVFRLGFYRCRGLGELSVIYSGHVAPWKVWERKEMLRYKKQRVWTCFLWGEEFIIRLDFARCPLDSGIFRKGGIYQSPQKASERDDTAREREREWDEGKKWLSFIISVKTTHLSVCVIDCWARD